MPGNFRTEPEIAGRFAFKAPEFGGNGGINRKYADERKKCGRKDLEQLKSHSVKPLDADDYAKKNQPAGKRSRLYPYRDGIARLVDSGYSLVQIREWLDKNAVQVGKSALADFIKRYVHAGPNGRRDVAQASPAPSSPRAPEAPPGASQDDRARFRQPQFQHSAVPDVSAFTGVKTGVKK